ncbi:hydrolase [Rhodococcus sp. Leaf7]|uniref:alpha/beta fold hydrolase n=1 Tax=unclassified Rhodococcus (in: high G+C Gram-positive bacteria) TaxID=192944 RepID=UPI0006F6C453|nr:MULTISPECIES: alpha/beta hydrolase [unclassified Rhodococcus (in: high G+C Gram-positive bacteria)]KQU03149.1 hydrolase [Rhodococcus sp. Leaf7]KQU38949.1 hydrolase [Rhodococcus sp. Leaf247]
MTRTMDIDTDLGRLHVTIAGDGPPLLAWHSLFVDSTSWNRVLPALAGERTVYMIDAPGCGGSESVREPTTIEACAAAAAQVVEEVTGRVGVPTVDWIGNAWGGHVGMVVAATMPESVRSLVAISSPTHPLGPDLRRKISVLLPLYRLIGPRGPVRSAIEDTLFTEATRASDPEAVDLYRAAVRRAGRGNVITSVRTAAMNRTDLSAAARSIACPVLFLTTDDRGEWTPDEARAVARTMVDAREVTIAGSRVLPAVEQPAAVADAVLHFWKTTPAVRRDADQLR